MQVGGAQAQAGAVAGDPRADGAGGVRPCGGGAPGRRGHRGRVPAAPGSAAPPGGSGGARGQLGHPAPHMPAGGLGGRGCRLCPLPPPEAPRLLPGEWWAPPARLSRLSVVLSEYSNFLIVISNNMLFNVRFKMNKDIHIFLSVNRGRLALLASYRALVNWGEATIAELASVGVDLLRCTGAQ